MRVKIHGGRGSHPVSVLPQRIDKINRNLWEFVSKHQFKTWEECESALKKEKRSFYQIYGGHTTCVELHSVHAPMGMFFDAGTGITAAGLDPHSCLNTQAFQTGMGKAAIFITHTHWDHIIGLPTLEQLYRIGNEFHFYGVHKRLSSRIHNIFKDEHFPVPFKVVSQNLKFHQLDLGELLEFGKLRIRHEAQTHPGGSFAYRVEDGTKSMVMATDVELKNFKNHPHLKTEKNIYSEADLLILDAQFSPEDIVTKEGYGHTEIYTAVDFAIRERVKKLLLFHQSPTYDDEMIDLQLERARIYKEKNYKEASLHIEMAIEGLVLEV